MTAGPRKGWLRRLALTGLALLLCGAGCAPAPYAAPPTTVPTATAVPAPDLTSAPWVSVRDGEPLAAGEAPATLIAVGDVLLGRGVAGDRDPLRYTTGWLPFADLALGNLEGVLADDLKDQADQPVADLTRRGELRMTMLRYPLQVGPDAELRWLVAETDAMTRFRSDVPEAVRHALLAVRAGSRRACAAARAPREQAARSADAYGWCSHHRAAWEAGSWSQLPVVPSRIQDGTDQFRGRVQAYRTPGVPALPVLSLRNGMPPRLQ